MGKLPVLNVVDPELIKLILVKDFHIFPNRSKVWKKCDDSIRNSDMFHMGYDGWRRVRPIVTTAFTTSKIRKTYATISACAQRCTEYLDILTTNESDLDAWVVFEKLGLDVMATRQKSNFNAFREFSAIILPQFVKRLLQTSADTKAIEYFVDFIRHIVSQRRQHNHQKSHNDFTQLLMDAIQEDDINGNAENTSDKSKRLSENEIIAQSLQFILAGYSSIQEVLAYTSYHLALNPGAQQRLYDEIIGAMDSYTENIPYDRLARLPYLDAVLSETLRQHLPALPLARIASTDYKLGETGVTIKAGQQVEIPAYVIHHSPQFYPDPFKYDPDRFMPQNKSKLVPYTYLPFGAGPRNCVATRFALLIDKVCIAHVVRRFRFYRCPQTDVPIHYKRFIHVMSPKRVIVGIEARL
ncbi:unnamed protein product [Oppiella nova]|uniref:Cytochrome P450 n=1 Tax=Oppiella nova TaxID=334625 RepID=A0A7R9QSZ4_9ACAR|nr:unnamed protein product [Oppiella nova]CAG2173803.1 unnamed protein product [Oppiella nova]